MLPSARSGRLAYISAPSRSIQIWMDHSRQDRRLPRHRRPGRRAVQGLLTLTIGLVSATATFAFVAPPATGQEDPDVARAREKLEQTQTEANAAHDRYQKAVDERDQVQGQITQLEQAIPELRAREAELRSQLSTRAAALYKNTDPSAGLEVLAAKDHIQAGRKTKLTEAADDFDNERARQLRETADAPGAGPTRPRGQGGATRGGAAAARAGAGRVRPEGRRGEPRPRGGRGDRRAAGAGRAGDGADGALGPGDGGVVPVERRVTAALGRDVDRRAGADLRRGRDRRERAGRLRVRAVVHRDRRLPRRRERQQLLGSRRVRRLLGRETVPDGPRRGPRRRSSISATTPTATRGRPISAIPRRRSGTGRTRRRRPGTSTRSSPRAGRRSGR